MSRTAKLYDCGAAGMLTAPEIARRTGLSHPGVYLRIARGVTGDALVAPAAPGNPPRMPARLPAEIEGMIEEIQYSTRPEPRPVYLAATLDRLHRLNRGPSSQCRLVGYYKPAGFDPEAFRETVLEIYREAHEQHLARRRQYAAARPKDAPRRSRGRPRKSCPAPSPGVR